MRRSLVAVMTVLALALAGCRAAPRPTPADPTPSLRVATYNGSLYDVRDGGLIARLEAGDDAARRIAAVIQHQRPDLLLLNEFDYDAEGRAADLFQRRYLEVGQFGQQAIAYPYRYIGPVNTGVPSGMDLDRDGKVGGGNDAFGFGLHPGQYGMLVLSKYPIDAGGVRSFQRFLWKDLPGARSPVDPKTGTDWYPPEVWSKLRLSSKSHWDVPVLTPLGLLHFLVHHPTPPVFDGPEDRNGVRNRDEIRFWAEYLDGAPGRSTRICSDSVPAPVPGHPDYVFTACGGLPPGERFVIAGDHNADPVDGDSSGQPMDALLRHPRVLAYPAPRSEGAVLAAREEGGANLTHKGDPAEDTGDFGPRVGNLRLDYVLPSQGLRVLRSGVFWPKPGETGADWITASDHHMVWLDLARDE